MGVPRDDGLLDIVRYETGRAPRARLLCLPCAGRGPLEYRAWAGDDLPEVEVCAVLLPGRETRMREPPFRRLPPLLAAVIAELRALPELPLLLFGHSMGALLAFELGRRLQSLGAPPVGLMVAARIAPQLQDPRSRLFELPDDAFLARLRAYGGAPSRVLADAGLMRQMMPTLRADFEMVETYRYLPALPLRCPITAVGGSQDPFTSTSDLEGWAEHTSGGFSRHMLPGGHFFPSSQHQALLSLVRGLGQLDGPGAAACFPVKSSRE